MYTFDQLKNMDDRMAQIGAKAESLVRMREGGFNVPDGFVVCVGENAGDIDKFADGKTQYAVRSSGTSEDLEKTSFAGQYDTYLNVQGVEQIENAIRRCQNSINNDRLKAYAKKANIDISLGGVAVIVQEMVPAKKAGVAFSVDSLNGLDKEIIIEAVSGLGDQLVGGQVTPDYYSYNWYTETFTAYNGGVLTKTEVLKLSKTILDIQEFYGFPVDVEWAMAGEEIFILQSRPITTIGYKAIPDEWTTADFRDGGVSASACKALMASLYGLVFGDSFTGSLKTIKLLEKSYDKPIYDIYFGRPYWRLTIEKDCFSKLPGYVERKIDEDLGIAPTYDGDGLTTKSNPKTLWNAIRALSAISKHIKAMEKSAKAKKSDLLRRFEPFENLDLSNKTGDELQKIWADFAKNHYRLSESTYFGYIFCNVILSALFKGKIQKLLPDDEITNLYTGLSDLSHMRPIYEAWELAHGECNAIAALLKLMNFIKKYKHHSQHELDISFPNWDECPEIAQKMIEGFAKQDKSKSPKLLSEIQKQKYMKTLAKVPPKLHKNIRRIRSFLWWREEFRDISTKSYHIVRKLSLALGQAWESEGILETSDDIFHLTESDICDLGNINLNEKKNLKEIAAKNRKYYNSFLNYKNPDEIGNRHNATETGEKKPGAALKGVACSGETITGRAKLILDIHDSDRLQQGDILVTKCTDPAWTAAFGKLSGVITETGGILSHAAVVSREYGISCILAVKNATDAIKDGDIVTMDCKTGEIHISRR